MKATTRFRLASFFALLLLASGLVARADLELQPACEHSSLVATGGVTVRDDEFAALMKKILLKNGTNANVRDAKFLFQECYGGGMIDDLQNCLSNRVKWVAGAAAKHNEWGWGYDDETGGTWTDALKDELAKTNQSLNTGIDNAGCNDTLGAKAKKPLEHGQSATGGGGESITLGDTNALSHHAVLWGGDADSVRHFVNMDKIYKALTNAWGSPRSNVSICVLFGDGQHQSDGKTALPAHWNALPASKSNLVSCLCALTNVLNTNEQFFFYATDHGGWEKDANKAVTTIPSGGTQSMTIPLALDILREALRSAQNIPTVSFEYGGGPAVVTLNGQFITTLNPSQTFRLLSFSESLLASVNTLTIQNSGPGDFFLQRATLSAGVFDTPPPVSPQARLGAPAYNRNNSVFSFTLAGEPGLDFSVESTLNFQTWSRLASGVFQPGQILTFSASAPPSSPRRFYRAVSTNGMVHASAGNHGSVMPPGPTFLAPGTMLNLVAVPEAGYEVDTWYLDGVALAPGSLTFPATAQRTPQYIQVTFRPSVVVNNGP